MTDLTETDSFPGKEIALFEDKSLLLVPSVLKPAMSCIDSVPAQSNGSCDEHTQKLSYHSAQRYCCILDS
jgi:hypothetical protein